MHIISAFPNGYAGPDMYWIAVENGCVTVNTF